MLLVVTYSTDARQTLRNICQHHEETVIRRFGRAALFDATQLGAFLALRLRERHGPAVQIERTEPFNEFSMVPAAVRDAVHAYEQEAHPNTPYRKFAAGTEHPLPEELADREV